MIEIKNRKASFDYEIIETYEAGIVLNGTEIKSIRGGHANLKDCYAIVKNNEVFILNMHISKYKEGNIFNHDELRTRKLLLHKKEIYKLRDYVSLDGYTLIPLKAYFKNNKVKILLGVCRGRKNYDKREVLKRMHNEKEVKKQYKYLKIK